MKKNKHIGTSFDDFLLEEGLLAEAEATAVKRIICLPDRAGNEGPPHFQKHTC